MSKQRGQQSPVKLAKLAQLYEMRQEKARKSFQEQQQQLRQAEEKLNRRQNEFDVVNEENTALQHLEQSDRHASDLRVQQHIAVKRRWLKYDFEKAQYFLNDAQSDVDIEKQEADKLRGEWMQLRSKVDQFNDLSTVARRKAADRKEEEDESELEFSRWQQGGQQERTLNG